MLTRHGFRLPCFLEWTGLLDGVAGLGLRCSAALLLCCPARLRPCAIMTLRELAARPPRRPNHLALCDYRGRLQILLGLLRSAGQCLPVLC